MTVRRPDNLSHQDRALRLREIVAENRRLRRLLAKLEVANISLKNESAALKKNIETRASQTFIEMLGKIKERAGDGCAAGPTKSRRDRSHT